MMATASKIPADQPPELLAAGTDLMERRRSGVSRGAVTQLARTDENARITRDSDGSAVIGCHVTIAAVASDPHLARAYPGLAAAAGGLATPQIRSVGTIGGNLAQRSRCWYYRNPHMPCLKKGDGICPARPGNHLYGVILDLGPCVAPHPSTLGAALMAYEATVITSLRPRLAIADLFGDGSDGTRDNMLEQAEQILAVVLPPPVQGERARYRRAISRAYAEWPLVEAVVRIVADGDRVKLARVAAGGIAPVPVRLTAVEESLVGKPLDEATLKIAARRAAAGAKPLPQTGYKVALMEALVADMLAGMVPAPPGLTPQAQPG
jgi:xanthine dehydrogenase YagS FAD-binding subunit